MSRVWDALQYVVRHVNPAGSSFWITEDNNPYRYCPICGTKYPEPTEEKQL